jgi:hypothetical protein
MSDAKSLTPILAVLRQCEGESQESVFARSQSFWGKARVTGSIAERAVALRKYDGPDKDPPSEEKVGRRA